MSEPMIFGTHDENTLAQFADVASRAERAALMSDGHVGYIMPIGGVAAYKNKVSVVGVGFDIACIAAGERVGTAAGFNLPIEVVHRDAPLTCWDGKEVRTVSAQLGAVSRGVKPLLRLRLEGGRELRASADHLVRTMSGWKELGELSEYDSVAVHPFVGLPYVDNGFILRPNIGSESRRLEMVARDIEAVPLCDSRFPAVLRLLGYIAGDGHLSRNGKRVSIYTSEAEDVPELVADFVALGFKASVHTRQRRGATKPAHTIYVDSMALNEFFYGIGCPRGKKEWSRVPFSWLLDLPDWAIAHFLSGFASAEGTSPRVLPNGTIPNTVLTQSGVTANGLDFVADLLSRLGFDSTVAPYDSPRNTNQRQKFVLQVLGGAEEQIRFMEQVGFARCAYKRRAAATVCSSGWKYRRYIDRREGAQREARALHAAGNNWRDVIDDVSRRWSVGTGFVSHAIYSNRGQPRRVTGEALGASTDGEIVWAPVEWLGADGFAEVYDVVTGDEAHAFFANGVVVHNCGNAAIRTNLNVADFDKRELVRVANEIDRTISFGVGRKNQADDAPVDHRLFESPSWDAVPAKFRGNLQGKARSQLGTVGSGNHYVDVFAARSDGALWVGVHFGSRGLGHTIASGFLNLSQDLPWDGKAKEAEVLLDLDSPLGQDYWALMNLAGEYAYAGREWVARKVVSILGGEELELIHNHHNFAWCETHDGEEFVVIRKGATPAFPGQKGFIGGSMGDDAVIVQGSAADSDAQRAALYSTVHGAGRVMSRTAAAGKRNRKTGEVKVPGKVSPQMMADWIAEKGVILRGGGLDESPHAYRRLPDVLAAQGPTIEVLHTLRPLIVVMAGANEYDPFVG